jgi:hypothetical protein
VIVLAMVTGLSYRDLVGMDDDELATVVVLAHRKAKGR